MESKRHVFLVVDDKIENSISLKALIKEAFEDSEVLVALSGKDSLRLAHEREPDIILLDIMMPDLDGFEVCRALKADENLRGIPVVFVTALRNDKQTRIRALESGAEAFLSKPIDEIELVAQLKAMLKIRELNIRKKETIKSLESDLIKSTRNFNMLAEKIYDALLFVNMDGTIVDVNHAAIEKYGYSYEEFTTLNILDLRHDIGNEQISEQMKMAAEKGIIFETIHYKKDNSPFAVEVSAKGTLIGDEEILLCIVRDISERKKAEEELRDSEQKYRALFESAEGAILLFADGRWVDCNAKALDIFGCTREQIIGEHPIRFSPLTQPDGRPSDEEAVKKIDLAYLTEPQLFEWMHRRADGTSFPAEVSLKRVDLGDKSIIQAIVLDISDRKKAEIFLRESEEKHRLLITQMTQGLALHEVILNEAGNVIDYRFIDVNQAFERLTGLKRAAINGKTVLEVMPKLEQSWIQKYGHVAMTGEPLLFENYSHELGKYFEVVAYSPRPNQFATIISDITDRKKIEKQLQQRTDDLMQSQRIAHIGTWRLDLESNEVIWSEELYKIFGLDPAIPPPNDIGHRKLFTPESYERISSTLEQTSTSGIPYELELETVKFDESKGWIWVRGEAEKDSDGNIIALRGVAHDITEQKQSEIALITLNHNLRRF